MPDGGIQIGQIYRNADRPHHVWRVAERHGDRIMLERQDNPAIVRFPDAAALTDPLRYVRLD